MKDKWRKWLVRFLFPHWLIKVFLVVASVILLVYSLGYENPNPIIAYSSYAISAYTLTIVMLKSPDMIRGIKKRLHANKYSGRYLSEPILRAMISLYVGSVTDILYALFYFTAGIYYKSVWTGAIAVYYIILSLMRVGLVKENRMKTQYENENEARRHELRSCYLSGCFMFLLNIAITGLAVQMIWQGKYYDYPGFMIYAQAAYTFYCLTMAIINLVKYRNMTRPILSAAKVISLSCALMSVFALQTAMLTQFGDENENFSQIMNAFTGGAVCACVFAMAIWLVYKTGKEIKRLEEVSE